MTSEIRTNSLTSRAGLSTVTMTDSGPMFSGITTFVDNSGFTFGVGGGTSIFTPATNVLTFGTNNTEKIRIDASGHMHGVGVITATHFYGDGSNLTGITQTTINSNTNNYLITGTGTANTLQGETRLTFDGNSLDITGSGSHPFTPAGGDYRNLTISGNSANSSGFIYLGNGTATTNADFDLGRIRIHNGATEVALITGTTDTSANDDGRIEFHTRNTGGSLQERLRIRSDGNIGIGNNVADANWKLKLVVPDNASYQSAFNVTNNQNSDFNVVIKSNVTAIGNGTNNPLVFFTNGSGNEKLRILSTGEMGLGTQTPPTGSFHIHLTETPELNLFSTQHSQGNHCKLNFGVGQSASVDGNTGARIEMNIPNSGGAMSGELKFHTNSGDNLVERVRIPASTWGLLVTNLASTGATGGYQTNGVSLRQGGDSTMVHDGGPPLTLTRKSNAGKVLDFYNGTTYAGGIYVNGNNQTQIQQGSDYRLKTDITSMTDGINKVKQLNPIYYKSKDGFDTTTVQNGFLAHEVQSVLPTLVDGEKDAPIDEKGKGYQTLNYAGFTPTAIAAIKELIAKVETLEAKVAALESS